ncbi:MAG: glycosyl hydrolase family 95 catalytic domain-containing protein, partial [Planctomycetota bacterium]
MLFRLLTTCCALAFVGQLAAVDDAYLSNFDLRWNRMPTAWEEGAFLGNGEQGTNIWAAAGETLHFDLGDTRIYSQKSRAPIGKFVLTTAGTRQATDMTLSLHGAEASATITTDRGSVALRALTSVDADVTIVELTTSGDERISIDHVPLPGAPADKLFAARDGKKPKWSAEMQSSFHLPHFQAEFAKMPIVQKLKPEDRGEVDGIHFRHVPLDGGQSYVLTWTLHEVSADKHLLAWRTDYALSDSKLKTDVGAATVRAAVTRGYDAIRTSHRAWWADYFANGFLSIPDKRMEANYWAQVYKYGAATRASKLPIDLMGPWFRATPWPRIWANLNVQLSYLPMAVANKPGVAQTLPDWLDASFDDFIQGVPKEFQHDSAAHGRGMSPYGGSRFWGEYGNFLWTLYDYWHFLRVYPDDARTTKKFYPLLKRGVNFLVHALEDDGDGVLHMPIDTSPEWKKKARDTAYNLEFLRWGLELCRQINDDFKLNDGDAERYGQVLAKLAPTPIDPEQGVIMLGENLHLTGPHRH